MFFYINEGTNVLLVQELTFKNAKLGAKDDNHTVEVWRRAPPTKGKASPSYMIIKMAQHPDSRCFFGIGSRHLWCFGALVIWCFGALVLWCWGQNTSRIQHKYVYTTFFFNGCFCFRPPGAVTSKWTKNSRLLKSSSQPVTIKSLATFKS